MNRHVAVPFFETIIFPDIMQVVSSDHDRPLHLHFDDHTSENPPPNTHVSSEWTLLVNVPSGHSLHDTINYKSENRHDYKYDYLQFWVS